jgi:transposase
VTLRITDVRGEILKDQWDVLFSAGRHAQIFVVLLGASSYTYAEATWTQQLRNWFGSHAHAFEFFGGVPELAILDYVPRHIIRVMWPLTLCAHGIAT